MIFYEAGQLLKLLEIQFNFSNTKGLIMSILIIYLNSQFNWQQIIYGNAHDQRIPEIGDLYSHF
jgi:hypothetical protein